jgi:hypothetical protein
MIKINIPDEADALVELVKKKEFPKSYFASSAVTDWIFDHTKAAGEDDPEKSALADAIGSKLGISYTELLQIATNIRQGELNRCMQAGDLASFMRASCLIYGCRVNDGDQEIVYVEWNEWHEYSPNDLVSFSRERALFGDATPLPMEVLNRITKHYHQLSPRLDDMMRRYEHDVREYFATYSELFVIPTDNIDGIRLNPLHTPS